MALQAAAKLQSTGGAAQLAAMDAGPFDLQNPGGGENLVHQAKFNIVPGRRYGLIGRNGVCRRGLHAVCTCLPAYRGVLRRSAEECKTSAARALRGIAFLPPENKGTRLEWLHYARHSYFYYP